MKLRRFKLSREQQLAIEDVNIKKEEAERELEQARTIAQKLEKIRETNHFSRDFRKAMGGI